MFKELQKTLKPVDLNNKNFSQYAANDKANTASDAVYVFSDEFYMLKCGKILSDLKKLFFTHILILKDI